MAAGRANSTRNAQHITARFRRTRWRGIMRTIDAHGHIIVEEITASKGNEPWRPRIDRTPEGTFSSTADGKRNGPHEHECTDVPQMLRDLDQLRIDTLMISPPPYLFL